MIQHRNVKSADIAPWKNPQPLTIFSTYEAKKFKQVPDTQKRH